MINWVSVFFFFFSIRGVYFIYFLSNIQVTVGNSSVCAITTGEQVLKILGIDYVHSKIWEDVAVLAAMVVIYRILAYLGLRFLTGKQKG